MVEESTTGIPSYLHSGQFSAYDPLHLANQDLEHPVAKALDKARRYRTFHNLAGTSHGHSAKLHMGQDVLRAASALAHPSSNPLIGGTD